MRPMIPPPPPGFTEDVGSMDSSAIPPPPEGFTEDVSAPASGYWNDVKNNAIEGLKEIPGGASQMMRAASITNPIHLVQSGAQLFRGTPPSETETGQDVSALKNIATAVPHQLFQQATDIGKFAVAPAQLAMGTPPADTMFGKSFRERPLSSTFNVASAVIPATKSILGRTAETPASILGKGSEAPAPIFNKGAAVPEVASRTPSYLETEGGRGLYSTTGIRGLTVQKMARRGQNPGAVGTDFIKQIANEGGIGSTSAETWSKMNRLTESAGQEVGAATKAIADEAAKYGAVENPLAIRADEALKPLYDAWAEYADGYTSDSANLAKEFEHVHEGLAKTAERQGGVLSLDNIKKAMDEVGPLTHKGAPERQAAMSDLYGTLAETHSAMVDKIASQAKNPALKQNLLKANARYSKYIRAMPDVSRASAMESVGQPNLGGLIDHFRKAVTRSPTVQKAVMKTGEMFNKSKDLTAEGARDYLKKANGDKALARKLAADDGWSF